MKSVAKYLVLICFCSSAFAQIVKGMKSTELPIKINIEELNFAPCLKAMNEKTNLFKGKIHLLDKDGRSVVVKMPDGNLRVLTEKALYTITDKPDCTTFSTFDERVSPMSTVQALYDAIALGDASSKAAVAEACKTLPLKPPPSSGTGTGKTVTP